MLIKVLGICETNRHPSSQTFNKTCTQHKLAKSVDSQREHHHARHTNEEALRVGVQLDHPVKDGDKHCRRQDEGGEVCELLADEVDVGAVAAVEVLPQEDRQLQAKRVDHGEDVLGGISIGIFTFGRLDRLFVVFSTGVPSGLKTTFSPDDIPRVFMS